MAGIAGNDDNGSPDSFIRFGVPEDGNYGIQIGDHLKNGGAGYFYRIEVTPVKAELILTPAEFMWMSGTGGGDSEETGIR